MLRPACPLLVSLALFLGGCVGSVQTLDGQRLRVGSKQYSDYVLAVFKRQNSTLTELFDVYDTVNGEDAERLDTAEQRMIEACETLNSVAVDNRDGKSTDLGVLLSISSSVRACDQATRDADQLIREFSEQPASVMVNEIRATTIAKLKISEPLKIQQAWLTH